MSENSTTLMPELFASLANGLADQKIIANQPLTKTKQDFSDLLQNIESDHIRSEVGELPVSVLTSVSEAPVNTGKSFPLVMQNSSTTAMNQPGSDIFNRIPAQKRMNSAEHSIVHQQSLNNRANVSAHYDQGVPETFASNQKLPGGDIASRSLSVSGPVAESLDNHAARLNSNSDQSVLHSTSPKPEVISKPGSARTPDSLVQAVNSLVPPAESGEISGEPVTSEMVAKSGVVDGQLTGVKMEPRSGYSQMAQPGRESMLSEGEPGKESPSQMNVLPTSAVVEDAAVMSQSAMNPTAIHYNNILNGQDVQTQSINRSVISAPLPHENSMPDSQTTIDEVVEDSMNEIEVPDQILNKSMQLENKALNVEADTSKNQFKQYQLYASADKLIENSVADYSPVLQNTISTPASNSLATPTALQPLQIDKPISDPAWSDELGEQIKWISKQHMQSAEIRLNPAHLGSMEVKIQIQNEQASIQFTAMNATVKEALELAIPRLREMMESNGIQLTNVDVAEQPKSQAWQQHLDRNRDNHAPQMANHANNIDPESASAEEVIITPIKSMLSLDLFV